MEPMEVIDLSSDDEKSPPKKRDTKAVIITEIKKDDRKSKNDEKSIVECEDVEIVYNMVKNQKRVIDKTNNESLSKIKRIKLSNSKKEDTKMIIKNLSTQSKESFSSQKKINRIKPVTLSPQCYSSRYTKSDNDFKLNGNSNDLQNNNFYNEEELKREKSQSTNNYSFKINEGASSSRELNKPQLTVKNIIRVSESTESILLPSAEMIESFFDACREQDSSKDMEKIISKLKKRYKNLQTSYAKSGSFMQLIQHKKDLISKNPAKLFLHISEVMDEMKARQIQNGHSTKDKNNCHIEEMKASAQQGISDITEEDDDGTLAIEDPKDIERIKALEKAMRRCERYINKCENAEVNFDDENDSHYIMAEKYKHRMVELYNKYCEITGEKADAARPYLRPKYFSVTPLPSLNNAITSFVNMKITKVNESLVHRKKKSGQVRFTDALIFPDYVDILNCVKKCNEQENLQLTKQKQEAIAEGAFKELGRHLKHCRQADYYDTFSLYLEKEDCDPASTDKNLNDILDQNQKLGEEKMQQLLNEFVEKENAARATENGSDLKKEEDQQDTGDDESSDGTDDEDSDISENEEIRLADLNDSDENNETNDLNAKPHDDSKQNDNDDTELDKLQDDLNPIAETDLEIDKLRDDLNKKDNDGIQVDKQHDETNDKVNEVVELNEPQDNLKQKDDEEVDLDKTQDHLSKKSNDDLDLDEPQDEMNEKSNDDVVPDKSQDEMNEESNDNTESNTHANMECEVIETEGMDDEAKSVSVEKIDEKKSSIDVDISDLTTDEGSVDAEVTNDKNTKITLADDVLQQTEINCIAIKRIKIDQKTKGKTELGDIEKNPAAPMKLPINESSSTVATCKVNLMQADKIPEKDVIRECSPAISVNNTKVIDAPAVATTVELIDEEEVKKPTLRVRQFAKPPGSWEDFQSPKKILIEKTKADTNTNTEIKKIKKIFPAQNQQQQQQQQQQGKFIKLGKPISIEKTVQVNNGFSMHLKNCIKNQKSTVMIPVNTNSNIPQINVENVTNKVTLNFNHEAKLQQRGGGGHKSIVSHGLRPATQNLISIDNTSRTISTPCGEVRVININSDNEGMVKVSNPIRTVKIDKKNTSSVIKKPNNQFRFVNKHTTEMAPQQPREIPLSKSESNEERTIIRHIPAVTDVNGKRTMYRLIKRSPGKKPQNIILPIEATIVQNQTQKFNTDLKSSTAAVPKNSKFQILNSVKQRSPLRVKVPRQTSNRVDNVYEKPTDSVPVYVVE